ncbi:hypothetical protein GLOIN_2v1846293 [Rhizophagus clarus]|uniref:AIG1-type G domain-containing protein n=1 Tax=Rhizophagus clarus TaxID=94130 RepID=A0A8H3R3E8_9GLOM|nr:hypothetical protein GLOIN_2v1846293 [Rhizophagus clarus]
MQEPPVVPPSGLVILDWETYRPRSSDLLQDGSVIASGVLCYSVLRPLPAVSNAHGSGAGKSTLGNLLLGTSEDERSTFCVSDSFRSVTKKSCSANYEIDGTHYNIVDTPGIFDTDDLNKNILREIARTVQKCAHGIKAILFVFEAKRFTEEQKEMIDRIRLFLGEAALEYMISVFSHCNTKQTKEPEYFKRSCWNDPVKAFVNSVGNRWAISPNPEIFPPDDSNHKLRLEELEDRIISIDGVYTNDLFEKAREKQVENERIAREAEERRQKEYNEVLRREGEAIARANYESQKAEDEKKAREARDRELEFIINTLKEQIKDLNNKNNKLADEIHGLKNPKSCFWIETQVKLESGRIIQMSELQIGDRVLSNIRNGIAEFSEVYLISHIGKLDHESKFAKVSFTRPDGSKGNLF